MIKLVIELLTLVFFSNLAYQPRVSPEFPFLVAIFIDKGDLELQRHLESGFSYRRMIKGMIIWKNLERS